MSLEPEIFHARRPANRPPQVVKSAVRVLEVLEFFDITRAPACVGLVATALGFPQSSTSALLRSLVKVGYLRYDPHARTYVPTERVPLLGNWIGRSLFQGGGVLDMMERLAQRTECSVVLARRTGCQAQYVHLADTTHAVPDGVKIGAMLALPGCAVGQLMLAAMGDAELRRLLHRLNAEAPSTSVVRLSDFMARMTDIRAAKFAMATDPLCTVLAVRLPVEVNDEPMMLGLAGTEAEVAMRADELLMILREELRTCLRPVRPTLASFDVPAPFALPAARRATQHVAS